MTEKPVLLAITHLVIWFLWLPDADQLVLEGHTVVRPIVDSAASPAHRKIPHSTIGMKQ